MSEPRLSWSDLYERRLDWALDTKEAFLRELESEALRGTATRQVQGGGQQEAVVVGATNAGKTRLVLRMQGVRDPETLNRLEDVVQGESEQGNPSTPVPTTYSVSPADVFRVEGPSDTEPREMDRKEARSRLADVRQRMEDGNLPEGGDLRIEIPRSCVAEQRREGSFNVVDLPGLDGLSKREQRYARDLAATYLYRAHLVMLVGRADTVPDLFDWIQTESDILPRAAWTHQTSRFAVVLTHAASAISRQNQITNDDGPRSEEEFVRLYEEDIEKEEEGRRIGEGADSLTRLPLYPVELGRPDGLDAKHQRLVSRWTRRQIEKLVRRAKDATSEIADLKFLVENYRSAKERGRHAVQRLERRIGSRRDEVQSLEHEIEEYRHQVEDLKETRSDLRAAHEQLPDAADLRSKIVPDSLSDTGEFEKTIATPSALAGYLRQEESRIISAAGKADDDLRRWVRTRRLGKLDIQNKSLTDVAKDVLSSSTGRLRAKFRSMSIILSQGKWKAKAEDQADYAASRLQEKIKTLLRNRLEKRKEKLESRLGDIESQIDDKSALISRLEGKRNQEKADASELEAKRERQQRAIRSDLERWRELRRRLETAFREEVKRVEERMAAGSSAKDVLLLAAYLRVLKDQHEAVIAGQ